MNENNKVKKKKKKNIFMKNEKLHVLLSYFWILYSCTMKTDISGEGEERWCVIKWERICEERIINIYKRVRENRWKRW